MNKNVIMGVAALGGLLLVSTLFFNNSKESKEIKNAEDASDVTSLSNKITSGIPIYPHTEVKNSNESSENGTQYFSFSILADTTIKDVNDWYRKELGQNGWGIKSDSNIGGYQIIQGENQNLYTSMQAANGDDPGTVLISQQVQIRPTQ
jgi:hypothetical protein